MEPDITPGAAEEPANHASSSMQPGAQRIWLAGLGAVAAACDRAGDQFDRFVQRGERVRDELQGRADDLRQERTGARVRMRDYVRQSMDAFWDAVHVPNKTDVDTINVKLNLLTRKIDDLQMQAMSPAGGRSRGTPPAAEPAAEAAADTAGVEEPGELYPPS